MTGEGMQARKHRVLKRTRVDLIPMIDTMFFLLVFFILSSATATQSLGISLGIGHGGASSEPGTQVNLTIQQNGRLFVNDRAVTANRDINTLIADAVRKARRIPADQPQRLERALKNTAVLVIADPRTPHQRVVAAIDQTRQLRDTHGKSLIQTFAVIND